MSAEHQRLHLMISGRVQGVWYRAHTQRAAQRLGLCGWVRNRRTGQVEAVAEGPRDDLESLEAWCWKGSPSSRVTGVDAEWLEPTGEYSSFEVISTR